MTGKDLKWIRQLYGETQQRFGERMGYKAGNTINLKENGKRMLTKQDEIILTFLEKQRQQELENQPDEIKKKQNYLYK